MDALRRAAEDTRHIDDWTRAIAERKDARKASMLQAEAEGATRKEIAAATGLSLGRVVQIMGALEPGRGGVKGGKPRKKAVEGGKAAAPKTVKGPKPEPHRHHYANTAWNHTRGAYLVRQRCECGDERVIPAPSIPKDLTGDPDPSVRAA